MGYGFLKYSEERGKMAEAEVFEHESPVREIKEQIHEYWEDSSSSDSDHEHKPFIAANKKRLFGREEPVHKVLGGGKSADIILWRNKRMSAGILASVTAAWLLFEFMYYHLLTLISNSLIGILAVLFIWSNASFLFKRSPPKLPEVILPEEMFLNIARVVSYQFNEAFTIFRNVASGENWMQFVMVVAGLWVLSVVGSWFDLLTLFYIVFVLMYTVLAVYEKYEDHVDGTAEKVLANMHKHCAVLEAKIFQKIPKFSFLFKKHR